MKLGLLERWLMNNPLRPLAQRHFEARQLRRMGGKRENAIALEIGCGKGDGIGIIRDLFRVKSVHAFDLDAHMVGLASKNHHRRIPEPCLWVGNVRHLPVKDAVYDAVFDFGILHHVLDWPSALIEIHRVLKPGGRFYIEEIPRQIITHPIWRKILVHPQENRFDHHELKQALRNTGFVIRESKRFGGLFIWCIADK